MSIAESLRPGARLRMAACCAAFAATPASALDYQVHGFLSQGFVLSEGNDFYGDSREGSLELYEVGLNGTFKLLPSLTSAAQVLARDAGATDDGKPRLDFAFLDYNFPGAQGDAGLRAGRVKNPYGLYNDTRDVVFARPGILLPQSVYYEAQGARSLLFSSNGLQAYGGFTRGEHYTSLVMTWAPDQDMGDTEAERFAGDFADDGDVKLEDFYFVRLLTDWNGGSFTTAVSYVHGKLDFRPDAGVPVDFDIAFELMALSARYNARRFSITSEYAVTDTQGTFAAGGPPTRFDNFGEGIYVQGDWRLDPAWTLTARWDSSFTNRNDREGDDCMATLGPADPHQCFAHDASVGVQWRSPRHWGAWAEYHLIDGLASASPGDIEGETPDPHWSMLLLMAAYRF